jgi:Rieske Fe-S protein
MKISRREFLILTATFSAGCAAVAGAGSVSAGGGHVINAGPVTNYAADGVYGGFRDKGFFIVRRGGRLFALSAICTHRRCKLKAEPDRSFYCPCHGSTFDPAGHVTEGPARRDLPVFPTTVNESGQLLVTI